MKKTYMLAAAVLTFVAADAQAIDSTGCGLGSMAWRGVSGPEAQILAVTTNTSTGSQTFGITFGTSGCDPDGRVTGGTQKMVLRFIENNMEQYALDAARGEGETLDTRQNFARIFPDGNVDAVYVTGKIFEVVKA